MAPIDEWETDDREELTELLEIADFDDRDLSLRYAAKPSSWTRTNRRKTVLNAVTSAVARQRRQL
jgi:hypothetical protein